jgi:DNA-binding NarL/FixJ family response regulator
MEHGQVVGGAVRVRPVSVAPNRAISPVRGRTAGERRDQAGAGVAEIRVAVADERQMIADALAALIDTLPGFSVTGLGGDDDAACATDAPKPDILLVGIGAGRIAGFALVRSVRARVPEVEIVIVTDALDPGLVEFVVDERLAGLILSSTSTSGFASALHQIANGRAVMPVGWQGVLVEEQHDALSSLSQRQMEVLKLLAAGCSYDEIATRLFITLNTVKFHVKSIFMRLGVCNRMAAARMLTEQSAHSSARGYSAARRESPDEPELLPSD